MMVIRLFNWCRSYFFALFMVLLLSLVISSFLPRTRHLPAGWWVAQQRLPTVCWQNKRRRVETPTWYSRLRTMISCWRAGMRSDLVNWLASYLLAITAVGWVWLLRWVIARLMSQAVAPLQESWGWAGPMANRAATIEVQLTIMVSPVVAEEVVSMAQSRQLCSSVSLDEVERGVEESLLEPVWVSEPVLTQAQTAEMQSRRIRVKQTETALLPDPESQKPSVSIEKLALVVVRERKNPLAMSTMKTDMQLTSSFVSELRGLNDPRDNRGKRHDLTFVLSGVSLAIMAGRSSVSSIHRFIKNRKEWLGQIMGYQTARPVSRAQLPRILAIVDWDALNKIIQAHFGFRIEQENNKWYALDGKTLRGIPGHQERTLLAVSHSERKTVAQEPMHGPKKSEITAVREMLAATGLEKARITLDALHFNPTTTGQINLADGWFTIQLKGNQPTLFAQMCQEAAAAMPLGTIKTSERAHGRFTVRQGTFFDISHLKLDPRWVDSGLSTLIVISRRTTEIAKQKPSAEVSFYLSNVPVQKGNEAIQQELFTAIRQHWGIESDNYIRDVSFQEDLIRTKDSNQGQVLASLRTLAMRLFREADIENFRAALDDFSDTPALFETFLNQYGFL